MNLQKCRLFRMLTKLLIIATVIFLSMRELSAPKSTANDPTFAGNLLNMITDQESGNQYYQMALLGFLYASIFTSVGSIIIHEFLVASCLMWMMYNAFQIKEGRVGLKTLESVHMSFVLIIGAIYSNIK